MQCVPILDTIVLFPDTNKISIIIVIEYNSIKHYYCLLGNVISSFLTVKEEYYKFHVFLFICGVAAKQMDQFRCDFLFILKLGDRDGSELQFMKICLSGKIFLFGIITSGIFKIVFKFSCSIIKKFVCKLLEVILPLNFTNSQKFLCIFRFS